MQAIFKVPSGNTFATLKKTDVPEGAKLPTIVDKTVNKTGGNLGIFVQ